MLSKFTDMNTEKTQKLMELNIIRKVARRFTDTFNEEIEDRLINEGLKATENQVDAVIEEIVKIYK